MASSEFVVIGEGTFQALLRRFENVSVTPDPEARHGDCTSDVHGVYQGRRIYLGMIESHVFSSDIYHMRSVVLQELAGQIPASSM
ncbi:hypothetical protein [Stutzerimonas kunmingensis]|uniref:hypothetical protein n=1 Tax=Stutzerimonas kunmingensis TaxID=1211807 RepID=UPI0028AB30CF|nr:hypothetical protein [Stutzerimonas kunmingensis]